MTPLAQLRGLTVQGAGGATILRGLDLDIPRGVIMGVVGESGSGKSTLAASLLHMLPGGLIAQGRILFEGQDLLRLAEPAMRRLRGDRIAMIYQDPMTALNPVFTIGTHLSDVIRRKYPGLGRRDVLARATAMLGRLGMPDPAARLRSYPHQLSGGMRQRVAIAMALLAEPQLLIADEPTTALDATVEAQIAALFARLRTDLAGSILFISHHLGLVAQLCDVVCVMYAGRVVETGPVGTVTTQPKHPYTQALLACEIGPEETGRLHSIPGDVPDAASPLSGCSFAPRCPRAEPVCRTTTPPLTTKAPGQQAACLLVPDV
jgi:oligopeptide/dipeptide ABC transporter ATP-binding protein